MSTSAMPESLRIAAMATIRRCAQGLLIAPDAFKGTFTSGDVTAAIAKGLRSAGQEADLCPVADGGEGTLSVLLGALGGQIRNFEESNLLGQPTQAPIALLADGGTAVVEVASVAGLALVAPAQQDAVRA